MPVLAMPHPHCKLTAMRVEFTKMHGLGNDFVVIDAVSRPLSLSPDQVRMIAHRRLGVGCDQVLLVESAKRPGVDFSYRIYNADGGEVEQCGNGARCFALFARATGLSGKDTLIVETSSGVIQLYLEQGGQVRVNMGAPCLDPKAIPFVTDAEAKSYRVEVEDQRIELGAVSMGNPHAVLLVDDVAGAPVGRLGPLLETHPRFPARVNVSFMEIAKRAHIRLRVWERGVGETPACGTAACAAVVVGRQQGRLDDKVAVDLPGGRLLVSWSGGGEPVWMTGSATRVFEGQIEL